MKKFKELILVLIFSFLIGLAVYFILYKITESSDDAFFILGNLFYFILMVVGIFFVIRFIAKLVFIAFKKTESEKIGAYFFPILLLGAIYVGLFISKNISFRYFPNANMRANMAIIDERIAKADVEKIKKLFGFRTNILDIELLAEDDLPNVSICPNVKREQYFPPYGTAQKFSKACMQQDVLVTTGRVLHGGSGVYYLVRQINGNWKIIDQISWAHLG
jgi:hypothetical protein